MEDKRKRYKCECPCGNIFYACKSLCHQMGMFENGSARCPECRMFCNLTFDEENQKMIVTDWEEYMKNRKKSVENEV